MVEKRDDLFFKGKKYVGEFQRTDVLLEILYKIELSIDVLFQEIVEKNARGRNFSIELIKVHNLLTRIYYRKIRSMLFKPTQDAIDKKVKNIDSLFGEWKAKHQNKFPISLFEEMNTFFGYLMEVGQKNLNIRATMREELSDMQRFKKAVG